MPVLAISTAILGLGATSASALVVTVTLDGPEKGSVTSNPPGIDCSNIPGAEKTDCSFDFPTSSSHGIKLSAVGGDGAAFKEWTGNAGGTCSGTVNPCTTALPLFIPLDATATFAPKPDKPSASTGAASDAVFPAAVFSGTVNPNSADFSISDCYFEYGTSTAYGFKAPCDPDPVGSGTDPVPVRGSVGLLAPGTTYHYRVVAINAGGKSVGGDRTFTSATAPADSCPNAAIRAQQGAIAQRLPDCLAYELVSPPSTAGQDPVPMAIGDSGEDVLFRSNGGVADLDNLNAVSGHPYRAKRTSSDWVTESLGLPPTTVYPGSAFVDWRADWWQVDRPPLLALGATPYDPDGTDNGSRVLLGTKGGDWNQVTPAALDDDGDTTLATAEDLSTVLLATKGRRPLTDGTVDTRSTSPVRLQSLLVSRRLADGTLDVRQIARQAGATMLPTCDLQLGSALVSGVKRGAVDRDGLRRVIWTTVGTGCTTGARQRVYATEPFGSSPDAVDISASKCTVSCGTAQTVRFAGASLDSDRVFMTTTQKLLDADTQAGSDIYEYDFRREPADRLQLVTGNATPANVLGVVTVSDTGSHMYFVARGALSDAVTGDTVPVAGSPNLYVRIASPSGGPAVTRFLATLPEADAGLWGSTARQAVATPDGRYLVVTSRAALTDDKQLGDTLPDVYRVDSSTGQIDRAWVTDPAHNGTLRLEGSAGPTNIFAHTATANFEFNQRSPRVAPDGSAFIFTSKEPLFAGDDNANSDVFVWTESDGVSMISDGRDPQGIADSSLWMTPDGGAFAFMTRSRLLPQHTATSLGLYVVRRGGGFPVPEAPAAPCAGEACQGLPSGPPSRTGVGSTTFKGGGNVVSPAAIAKVRVAKVGTVRGTSARIRVRVADKGKIRTSGSGLRRASRSASKAGTYRVTVKLSKRAQRTLQRTHRMKVRVTVRFTPPSGKTQLARVPVTFETNTKKNRKSSSRAARQESVLSADGRKGR